MPYVKPTLIRIGKSDRTATLYRLEEETVHWFNEAAKEAARVRDDDELRFYVLSLPQALFDFLDNFDSAAVQIAAKAFLEGHPHEKDGDCGPFLDHHSTCQICGVVRGDPCPKCGGGSFHTYECRRDRLVSEAAAIEERIPIDELEEHAAKLRRRENVDRLVREIGRAHV